jgi:hypothetical protein
LCNWSAIRRCGLSGDLLGSLSMKKFFTILSTSALFLIQSYGIKDLGLWQNPRHITV